MEQTCLLRREESQVLRDGYTCRLYVDPPVLTDEEADAVARPEGDIIGVRKSFPFKDGLVGYYKSPRQLNSSRAAGSTCIMFSPTPKPRKSSTRA